MKSYLFRVVVEKEEDVWRAYVPELESRGAATWGHSKDEALRNIEEVLQMVLEDLLQEGESLPQSVTVAHGPMVAVNV